MDAFKSSKARTKILKVTKIELAIITIKLKELAYITHCQRICRLYR